MAAQLSPQALGGKMVSCSVAFNDVTKKGGAKKSEREFGCQASLVHLINLRRRDVT